MAFGISYKQTENNSIIPIGEYEVFIKSAEEKVTQAGKSYISVSFIVRNDVEQRYKNKYIWYSIWKKKEPNQADIACGGYNNQQIQFLSKAVQFSDGTEFASIQDWMKQLKGRVLKITIKHEEFNGKIRERVQKVDITKYPQYDEVFEEDDEDMPFDDDF